MPCCAEPAVPDRLRAGLLRALLALRGQALAPPLAAAFGPWTRRHALADALLAEALPDLSPAARRATLAAMWRNLGRVVAEMPRLQPLAEAAAVSGEAHLAEALQAGRGAVGVSAHLGNWELLPHVIRRLVPPALPVAAIYRAANDAGVEALVQRLRAASGIDYLRKGRRGAAGARATLAHGGVVLMLVDQRASDGLAAPFLGRAAMTTTAPARLALGLGAPILPLRMRRRATDGHALGIEPPLAAARDLAALTTGLNRAVEAWVRETPQDWLWLHDRWRGPRPPAL